MKIRLSITARLYVGFLILSVLALGALGTAVTAWFMRQESDALDQFLLSESRSITDRLDSLAEVVSLGAKTNGNSPDGLFRKGLADYMRQRSSRPIPFRTTLVVFAGDGSELARSNSAIDINATRNGGPLGVPSDVERGRSSYRVIRGSYGGSDAPGTFLLACFLSSLDGPRTSFVTSLTGLLAAILVMVALLGLWLIRVTLGPVRTMARAAARISDQNLSARIPLPPGRDDLARMAKTLNDLLGRLEQDFAFQEQLVGELTHQLKTPLTILRGRNELALADSENPDALREVVEDNLSDIDGLVTLLNTLLALVRFDSRIDKLKTQPVWVLSLVKTMGEELEPLWMSKSLRFSCEGDDLAVNADPVALRQILTNLFDNSWKYTPQGGAISVVCFAGPRQSVEITVTNTGPPIPEADLELIFKRFYRSRFQGAETPGSGLGLSIVRSLVELQGGRVVAANPLSGGAQFVVTLPRWMEQTEESLVE